jgi:hypothetical protein
MQLALCRGMYFSALEREAAGRGGGEQKLAGEL